MNSNEYYFQIVGKPIAQPRPRITRNGMAFVPSSHPVHSWKESIREAAAEIIELPFTGPVSVDMFFWMPRPKNMTWKTKAMPKYWHVKKPDVDNIAKAVLDALSGTAFLDDNQVSSLYCVKQVAEGTQEPLTKITVRGL